MNQCKNCQYFRENSWCSNSKSPYFRHTTNASVTENSSCAEFYERGKKAPLWMRELNKQIKKARK